MTLNEAVYKVIATQFKKNMDGADKVVEEAGYRVMKTDGRFAVRTVRENGRCRDIEFGETYRGYKLIAWNGNSQRVYRYDTIDDLKKFNFEGFLTAPINVAYADAEALNEYRYGGYTETQRKMGRLRDAKSYIRYKADDIKKYKKQIAELQEKIEDAIRRQVQYEDDLRNIRKEYGLIK